MRRSSLVRYTNLYNEQGLKSQLLNPVEGSYFDEIHITFRIHMKAENVICHQICCAKVVFSGTNKVILTSEYDLKQLTVSGPLKLYH